MVFTSSVTPGVKLLSHAGNSLVQIADTEAISGEISYIVQQLSTPGKSRQRA
jgi:hypothetical protein